MSIFDNVKFLNELSAQEPVQEADGGVWDAIKKLAFNKDIDGIMKLCNDYKAKTENKNQEQEKPEEEDK